MSRERPPSPELFFETINAYQRTAAMKAALELDVFTALGEDLRTAHELSMRCGTSERGMRILCDYLVILGFLGKSERNYHLTRDSALFLDRNSAAYMGGATEFMLSPMLTSGFDDLTAAIRKGGTIIPEGGTVAPENPVWVKFARAMAPMIAMPAGELARLIGEEEQLKVLDIAAGHGLFGIAVARHNTNSKVVAVDWPNVLEVAKENARSAGVADRYDVIEGSAFDVDYGDGYDVVLLTNFLHHFDVETCETLLRKVQASLSDGGRALTLEFVPNEDRVSPSVAASFSMMMLGSTPSGDAYTFAEFDRMFKNAGFKSSELRELPGSPQKLIISHK